MLSRSHCWESRISLWVEDFDVSTNTIIVRKPKTPAGAGQKVLVTEYCHGSYGRETHRRQHEWDRK